MAQRYWIAANGELFTTDNGLRIVFNDADQPPPMPSGIERILLVRSLIDDPAGAASGGVSYAELLPGAAETGSIWTTGNGIYYKKTDTAWNTVPTLISDAAIALDGTVYQAAWVAIARLLAMCNPQQYVQSFNTGGQTVSFSSWQDMRQHYLDMKTALEALQPKTPSARWRAPTVHFDGVR